MAQALVKLGHNSFVLLTVPSDSGISWDGLVPIHRIRVSGFASRLPEPFGKGASFVFARALARMAQTLRLDLVEAPEWTGLTAFLGLVKPRGLRVVVRLHTCSSIIRQVNKSRPSSLRERFDWQRKDWLERRSILTADAVTAVSRSIAEETAKSLRLPRFDFRVVPNSVNDSAFTSVEDLVETTNPEVLFIGRLEWRKGPDLLMRALPAVLERQPGALFRFAGMDTLTGPGNTSMKSHLESLLPESARSNVEFCGHLAPPQLEGVLRRATVCVFPSRYEGLPMVCLEAMAHGKAIVASGIPGFCELISHGETGMIVKREDPGSLASALQQLIADKQLRAKLGSAARETARAKFLGTVVAQSMLQVYRAAMTVDPSRENNNESDQVVP
jgi:glycosyltransferase involved in cell wall biosynthesis